jgi:choline dehydrogenase
MWPNGSKMAMVDFQRKVYKVEGVRVVDASIFPDAVSAAPNPTVIMVAEKVADQIKKTPPMATPVTALAENSLAYFR